jgi:hypothetical protein
MDDPAPGPSASTRSSRALPRQRDSILCRHLMSASLALRATNPCNAPRRQYRSLCTSLVTRGAAETSPALRSDPTGCQPWHPANPWVVRLSGNPRGGVPTHQGGCPSNIPGLCTCLVTRGAGCRLTREIGPLPPRKVDLSGGNALTWDLHRDTKSGGPPGLLVSDEARPRVGERSCVFRTSDK